MLLSARTAAGLTQAELEARSGVARPNIAAFEAGRREPRWKTATRTLEATGATIDIVEPIAWIWTTGRRPYPVPSGLWRLALPDAFGRFVPGPHLWWSGDAPRFDLLDREDLLVLVHAAAVTDAVRDARCAAVLADIESARADLVVSATAVTSGLRLTPLWYCHDEAPSCCALHP